MVRVLILFILLMVGSCKKDELIPIEVNHNPNGVEIKKIKTKKIKPKMVYKKRKFILFKKWKKDHGDFTKSY